MDWMQSLNIKYSTSTFDTDPFEPQPEGVCTTFPLRVTNKSTQTGYIELPYTIPQDFTVYIIMKEKDNSIWKKKLDWIAENGGMALLITHPDYMNFYNKKLGFEEYLVKHYTNFLEYIEKKYKDNYWHVLPKQMAKFWKEKFFITS
jgi:hypothetical protein